MKNEKELTKEFQDTIEKLAKCKNIDERVTVTVTDPRNENGDVYHIIEKRRSRFWGFLSEGWSFKTRSEKGLGREFEKWRSRHKAVKELTKKAVKAVKNGASVKIS